MSFEQRQSPRIPIAIQVRYAALGDFVVDYTGNISLGGCFIATSSGISLQEGQQFVLILMLPATNQDSKEPLVEIKTTATVRWVSQNSANPGIGVQYEFANEADYQQVQNLLSQHLPS